MNNNTPSNQFQKKNSETTFVSTARISVLNEVGYTDFINELQNVALCKYQELATLFQFELVSKIACLTHVSRLI